MPEISITKTPLLDIGLIHLQTETINLTGVTVSVKKPLFEQKIDRMIVNVKIALQVQGSTVLDVLQKSPGVIREKPDYITAFM